MSEDPPIDKNNNPTPYSFIAIEGNIGAGKTTFCTLLSDEINCRLILEQFTDNPFLPLFYEQPDRYAFPVELFFMTERHKQLQEALTNLDIFTPLSIADYFFIKTLLFAKNNLNTEEFRLFKRLFKVLNSTYPKPELLVYLHRSVDDLLRNIKKRGRTYETDISADYLTEIQNGYFDYFRTETDLPILILDVEGIDFVADKAQFEQLKMLLTKQYSVGIHRVKL
ncbi:MAG: deoxynucleoside kinase [Saprospiraceae bacterium]|nr:deoxynucleoside kinase [Saprospiraceae bacterium]